MNGTTGAQARNVITDLGHDVYEIDTRMAGYTGITAGYLILADRPCLVETGTAPSAPVVRRAGRPGVGPADLATIVVTHIHLDHAGGTGDLAAALPGSGDRGARARRPAPGRPVPADGQRADGVRRRAGRALRALAPTPAERDPRRRRHRAHRPGRRPALDSHYSPGHAKHHVGLVDSVSGDLYVGDAAGVYVPETGDMRPATPPPDFDLETALASLRTFRALRPQRLLFSHFGPVSAVEETLERSAEEIRLWVDETKRAVGSGLSLDHAAAMVAERTRERYAVLRDGADPRLAAKFERIAGAVPNVAGIMHWLEKTPGAA